MKFLGVTILQGVEFPIFLLFFARALQQCSATALPVICNVLSSQCAQWNATGTVVMKQYITLQIWQNGGTLNLALSIYLTKRQIFAVSDVQRCRLYRFYKLSFFTVIMYGLVQVIYTFLFSWKTTTCAPLMWKLYAKNIKMLLTSGKLSSTTPRHPL